MPKPPALPKIPRLRTFSRVPSGSRTYRYGKPPKELIGGPGDPPPGFLNGNVSVSEWIIYWALAKALGEPKDPRRPPFTGSEPVWSYQSLAFGGRNLGGSVPDFVIWGVPTGRATVFRLQSAQYHLTASDAYKARDVVQRGQLEATADVVDLYEQDFLADKTGQAAIKLVKGALGLSEMSNPVVSGTFRRT